MPKVRSYWPNQEDAAAILGGIQPSTVSRHLEELGELDRRLVERGKRGKLLAPRLVLQLAEQWNYDVFDAADALLQRADDIDDNEARNELRGEVNGFLREFKRRRDLGRKTTLRDLLTELRAALPPRVFAELEVRMSAARRR